jgi:alkylation response protein AidB-like acyl-CoA dehydrogenase
VNFDLSDEQRALRDAARDALTRLNPLADAHDVLDGGDGLDLWPTACAAGWPGLLFGDSVGGAELGAVEALLVGIEIGRTLARVPLLGHTCAASLIDGEDLGGRLHACAEGTERLAFVGAMPPSDLEPRWTVDDIAADTRRAPPRATVKGETALVSGTVAWVPDALEADALLVVALDGSRPVAIWVDAAEGVELQDATRYDLTRPLAHVVLNRARGTVLAGTGEAQIRSAWFLAQSWLAAEDVGAVETALERSVAYAKERVTFGRAIGSYQAIKHGLVEMLRRLENARSLLYYAGWAHADAPAEFALAASAARTAATHALDFAARRQIVTHGGVGVTWEHDAPLYHRRAEVSRRLLGGVRAATDRVAGEMMARGGH